MEFNLNFHIGFVIKLFMGETQPISACLVAFTISLAVALLNCESRVTSTSPTVEIIRAVSVRTATSLDLLLEMEAFVIFNRDSDEQDKAKSEK